MSVTQTKTNYGKFVYKPLLNLTYMQAKTNLNNAGAKLKKRVDASQYKLGCGQNNSNR